MNAPILSSLKINLPTTSGKLETFVLSEPRSYPDKAKGAFNRVAFSAAHVVADARAANDPWIDCTLDWDKTIAYRETCGTSASAWRRRWTRPSAAWGWTGRPRSS
jgi:hypothetical protein